MSAALNRVELIGRMARDPELRYTPNGKPVLSFGFAVNEKYKDQSGELREETTWVDITAWGKRAEVVAQYTKKGSQLFVEGRLRLESWQDQQTGQNRRKLSVVAKNIQFLDSRNNNGNNTYQQQPPQGNSQPAPQKTSNGLPDINLPGWQQLRVNSSMSGDLTWQDLADDKPLPNGKHGRDYLLDLQKLKDRPDVVAVANAALGFNFDEPPF